MYILPSWLCLLTLHAANQPLGGGGGADLRMPRAGGKKMQKQNAVRFPNLHEDQPWLKMHRAGYGVCGRNHAQDMRSSAQLCLASSEHSEYGIGFAVDHPLPENKTLILRRSL